MERDDPAPTRRALDARRRRTRTPVRTTVAVPREALPRSGRPLSRHRRAQMEILRVRLLERYHTLARRHVGHPRGVPSEVESRLARLTYLIDLLSRRLSPTG